MIVAADIAHTKSMKKRFF